MAGDSDNEEIIGTQLIESFDPVDEGPSDLIYKNISPDDLKAPGFFDAILQKLEIEERIDDLAFICVNHFVSSLPNYLVALQKAGRVAGVIKKSSCCDDRVKRFVEQQNVPIIPLTKEDIAGDPAATLEQLKGYIGGDNFVIIDIGGYSAPWVELLSTVPWAKAQCRGIVEDTENGHQKHEKVVSKATFPVISVARSQLKETEDFNIGKSIVRAADTIIRDHAYSLTERFKKIYVIGYGKIGSSTAKHLQQMNIQEIVVYEINPILLMKAASEGFKTTGNKGDLARADCIFSATGNQALGGADFNHLKNGVFITSVTSNDDEFDLTWIKEHATLQQLGEIYQYQLNGKSINLVYDGNAANFVYGGIAGPYIFSVQAELISSAIECYRGEHPASNSLIEFPVDKMKPISEIWLDHFEIDEEPHELIIKAKTNNFFNIPNVSPFFSGRVSLLTQLDNHLQPNQHKPYQPAVLSGLGGVGKSELALKFAWENRDTFAHCIYIPGTNAEEALCQIAQKLNITHDKKDFNIQNLYQHLQQQGRTLLIVDDIEGAIDYLPDQSRSYSQADFSIIVTTRNQQSWPTYHEIIMDPDENSMQQDAIDYVTTQTHCSEDQARRLATELQFLSLALSQAVAYIRQHPTCDVENYLELLQGDHRMELLAGSSQENRELKHKQAVATTWKIAMSAIECANTQRIMQKLAFLYPDFIPTNVFVNHERNDEILRELLQYSFIYLLEQRTIKIHRLLQEVIRDSLEPERTNDIIKTIIFDLANNVRYNRVNIPQTEILNQHFRIIQNFIAAYDIDDRDLADSGYSYVLYNFAVYNLDHLYEAPVANSLLQAADNLYHANDELKMKIKRQLAKTSVFLHDYDAAETSYTALLGNPHLSDKQRIDILLDQSLLFRQRREANQEKNCLDQALRLCQDNQQRARCYHYLGIHHKNRCRYWQKCINNKQQEQHKLEPWMTRIKEKIDREISDFEALQKTALEAMMRNLLQALTLKRTIGDAKEVVRTTLILVDSINRYGSLEHAAIAIVQLMSLFDNELQELDRHTHRADYVKAIVLLAKLYSKFTPAFEEQDLLEKTKDILKIEKGFIKKECGQDSEEYKLISRKKQIQSSLSTFFSNASGAGAGAGSSSSSSSSSSSGSSSTSNRKRTAPGRLAQEPPKKKAKDKLRQTTLPFVRS